MKKSDITKARFIAFREQCRKCVYGTGEICTLDADCTKCKMCFNKNKAEESCHCCVAPSKDEMLCKFFVPFRTK